MEWPEGHQAATLGGLAAGARSVASAWLDVTRWWTEALAGLPGGRPVAEAAALARLVADFAGDHRGRRVGFAVAGRPATARLEAVSLSHGRSGGRVVLREVVWDGWRLDVVTATADHLALRTTPEVACAATGLTIHATSSVDAFVAWLGGRLPEWSLRVTSDHLVEAGRRARRTRLVVDAEASDGQVRLELHALRRGRWSLRVPRWLRLTRRIELPALPHDASLAEARRCGSRVELRVLVPDVVRAIEPGPLGMARGRRPLAS